LAVASGVGVFNGFCAFFRTLHDGLSDAGCLDFEDEDQF
jgi:hypothetical protein